MDHLISHAVLGHTMAQSTVELLALIGPFALLFGLGTVLVINPIVKSEGERYQQRPPLNETTFVEVDETGDPCSREIQAAAVNGAAGPSPFGDEANA
jgi:hypothetical protein